MIEPFVRLNNIPPSWSSFVGRGEERSQIIEFLENSRNPILLVYGQRGVGKSSLVCSVANEQKEKFSSVVWLDRSNAFELFDKLSTFKGESHSDKDAFGEELTPISQKLLERLSRRNERNETIGPEIIEVAYKALIDLPKQIAGLPFLLVIDDFDEEFSLGTGRSADNSIESGLGDYIEQFVQYPNKLIITSRLRENCFKGLGYETLEIGLLQKQDVDTLIRRHMKSLDPAVWVNSRLDDTSGYIWNLSGGLAEFISRNIIPITTQEEFLLGRDPESLKANQEFAQCYLLEREQPTRLHGYRVTVEPQKLENRLSELFNENTFTEFVLWKWLNLGLPDGFSNDELGVALGINTGDDTVASKLQRSLKELHKHRFIARQIYVSDGDKHHDPTRIVKWILLPVIALYLKDNWPPGRQYWSIEATYLRGFIDANLENPTTLDAHYKRILDVITWCESNQDWTNMVSLGLSIAQIAGRLIESNTLPQSSVTYEMLVDICRKTADSLEQHQDGESWRPLIYVLLVLAKLYSSAKIESNQLLFKKAREYAAKALALAIDKEASEETDAKVLTAKLHLYVGEFEMAETLLLQVLSAKKAIKNDWAVTAYLLATILSQEQSCERSLAWYERIIDSISQHLKIDIALQSAVDAARFCSSASPDAEVRITDLLTKVSQFLKQEPVHIKKFPVLSVQVMAHTAAAFEKQQDSEKYKKMLQDAKQICKDCGLEQHPIYEGLNNRLVYLSQQELGTSLFEDLSVFTTDDSDALYRYDNILSNCPICRKRLLSSLEVVSCGTCDSSYHKNCLLEANINLCPICHEDLNLKE